MKPLNESPCTAIETAHGLLFFSQDDYGRNLMQEYLQSLTDHYFDRQNHDLKKLSLYYFLGTGVDF